MKNTGFRVKPGMTKKEFGMTKKEPGITTTCGIDEAGRGALAGPLVAAAVTLSCPIETIAQKAKIKKIKDGKLLKPRHRTAVYKAVKALKIQVFIEVITPRQINNHGIGWANKQAMRNLIKQTDADSYILDGKLKVGRINGKTKRVQSVVDADATIPEVMLAGIVAKVERDKVMRKLHKEFPHYRWWTNKGYGTRDHLQALEQFNTCRYHRNVFVHTALKDRRS